MAFGRLGTFGTGFGRLGHAPRTPWWLAGSSLDMDFVKNRARQAGRFYAPSALLTTTRASDAYSDDTAGRWSLFASGAPRITDKGLLVEEARTNSIRNNSMQGAVAGTPGTPPTNWSLSVAGLTRTIVGTGTENGVDYIDIRLNGTTSSTATAFYFDTTTAIAAVNGQTWASSAFLSVVGGSQTNVTAIRLVVDARDGAGGFLAQHTSVALSVTGSQGRFSALHTISNASTAFALPYVGLTVNNASAVDITLRIGWPQLELGAFATSPIRTTSAAATRAADAIRVPFSAAGAYTLFGQGVPLAPTTYTLQQNLVQVDAVNDTQRLVMRRVATTGGLLAALVGGTGASLTPAGTWAASARGKWATAAAAGDQASCFNGGTVVTGTAASLPTAPTALRLGSNSAATESFNGWIERVAGFDGTRLTNAQLQALTQ